MSAQLATLPRTFDAAARYAALGWPVFPLHWVTAEGRCSCSDPDCRSPAKHPLTVHGVKDASTDPAVIAAWAEKWPHASIGYAIRQGEAVVDVDPRNGGDLTLDALQEEHGALPDTVMQLTGGGGQHYLFRIPDARPVPGKLGRGVDVKSYGGYIVVEPSRHISGRGYVFEASADPFEGADLAALPDWIGRTAAKLPQEPQQSAGFIAPQRFIELRSALAHIDADSRDNWVRVGMALHSTGAGNAMALWTEWSQLSAKYDPSDQGRVWASFKGKTEGLHVESIFAMAAAAGWVNPASRKATAYRQDVEEAIERANADTSIELVEPAPQATAEPIPVPALNDLAAWIERRYPVTHPGATRQAVLAIAATMASRVYVGEGNTPCHLCLGLVADSAALTAYTRDAVAAVCDAAGLRRMLRGTRINAPINVYSTLFRSPAAIHVVGDFGWMAAYSKRQPSGMLDQAFAAMADAYSSSAIYLDSAAEAGLKPNSTDDQLVVYAPSLTTLLLSTREQMAGLLQSSEVSRGLLAHQLPLILDQSGIIEGEGCADPLPDTLRRAIRAVRRLPDSAGDMSQQDIFGAQPCFRPRLVRVRWASDFREHQAAIAALSTETAHRPLLLAAQETARRLITALGAWADPLQPTASREVMDWVTGYVLAASRDWLDQLATLGSDDGKADAGQKVVAAIADRKTAGLPRSQVHMYCRAFRTIRDREKRDALIDALLADGDLIEITPPGKRQKVLIAARFARRSVNAGEVRA